MLPAANTKGDETRSETILQNADAVDAVFRCDAVPHDRQNSLLLIIHLLREKHVRSTMGMVALGQVRRDAEPRQDARLKCRFNRLQGEVHQQGLYLGPL